MAYYFKPKQSESLKCLEARVPDPWTAPSLLIKVAHQSTAGFLRAKMAQEAFCDANPKCGIPEPTALVP